MKRTGYVPRGKATVTGGKKPTAKKPTARPSPAARGSAITRRRPTRMR